MIKNNVYYEFFASYMVPNSNEVGYWIDLGANSKGKIIKVYNPDIKSWVKLTDATSEDAVAPFIGSNGNWWIESIDFVNANTSEGILQAMVHYTTSQEDTLYFLPIFDLSNQ